MLGTSSELLLNIAHQTPLCIELCVCVCVSQYCIQVIGLIIQVPNILLINNFQRKKQKDADTFLSKSAVLFSCFIYLREPSNPSFKLKRLNDIHLY